MNKTWQMRSYTVKVSKGGRDNLYPVMRIPRDLADKYSINQECEIEVIDREDLGGILIKRSG